MNKKNSSGEEVPKKGKQAKPKKKKDGWFARNKDIFAIIIATIIIIAAVSGACWFLSYRISSLTTSLQKTEQKVDNLEQRIETSVQNQERLLTTINEINSRLTEKLLPEAKELKSAKTEVAPKTSESVQKKTKKIDTEISSKVKWYVLLVIIVVILLIIYFVIIKFRKKD